MRTISRHTGGRRPASLNPRSTAAAATVATRRGSRRGSALHAGDVGCQRQRLADLERHPVDQVALAGDAVLGREHVTGHAVVDVDQADVRRHEHPQTAVQVRKQIRPVPPARPGPWTDDGLTRTQVLADLTRSGERGALALGLGPLVRRQVPTSVGVRSVPTVPAGSPIVAAEDVCTSRATPARAAARTAATAPPTFIRSIGRGSSTHSMLTPATLNASAQPSIPA